MQYSLNYIKILSGGMDVYDLKFYLCISVKKFFTYYSIYKTNNRSWINIKSSCRAANVQVISSVNLLCGFEIVKQCIAASQQFVSLLLTRIRNTVKTKFRLDSFLPYIMPTSIPVYAIEKNETCVYTYWLIRFIFLTQHIITFRHKNSTHSFR